MKRKRTVEISIGASRNNNGTRLNLEAYQEYKVTQKHIIHVLIIISK